MNSRCCEIFIFFIFFTVVHALHFIVNGRPRNGTVGEPDLLSPKGSYTAHPKFIIQKLDNFNPDSFDTWLNRYYSNDEFYKEGGPIFLMLRGESPISPAFMVAGAWINYARKYNATLYQLEHRYYGDSIPTNDLSVENLAYLTSEQTLADAANFIRQMNMEHGYQPEQKWITFGGSYGGALAIWSREIYPDLVWGAVSSSGTVNAIVNFKEFCVDVSTTISNNAMKCGDTIRSAFQTITEMVKTVPGKVNLDQSLPLCESLVQANNLDISSLMVALAGTISYVVQYNHDFISHNNVSVNVLCDIMENNVLSSPIERLSSAIQQILKEKQESCIEFNYNNFISYLQNVSPDGTGGERQWFYQQCNEFGFFQDSNSQNQFFGHSFPVDFYTNECTEIFGKNFDSTYIYQSVDRTNLYFGGSDPKNVTNVLSVVGSADPWLPVIISTNLTNSVQALLINGTAHCADMYSASRMDPPQLRIARYKISQFIGDILSIGKTTHKKRFYESKYGSLSSTTSTSNNVEAISSNHLPQISSIPFVPKNPILSSFNFDNVITM